jgi:hypothetical protein
MRIMTGGAVGDATKKLFKVPFINDDCNLDALSAMLDKIEKREQVAQQFLAIPSNWGGVVYRKADRIRDRKPGSSVIGSETNLECRQCIVDY